MEEQAGMSIHALNLFSLVSIENGLDLYTSFVHSDRASS